jgi:hypothetical protein
MGREVNRGDKDEVIRLMDFTYTKGNRAMKPLVIIVSETGGSGRERWRW